MKVISSDSIVLRNRDFRERDRMITFLTRDHGGGQSGAGKDQCEGELLGVEHVMVPQFSLSWIRVVARSAIPISECRERWADCPPRSGQISAAVALELIPKKLSGRG